MHLSPKSLIDTVGGTPLRRLSAVGAHLPAEVELYGKVEAYNPGGSVKDRPARQIILDAIERGELGPGVSLLDSTSGNTGVAYAMIGAALGIEITLVMPSNVSEARKDIVQAYGAKLIYSDPLYGSDGAIELAQEIASGPDAARYWYADQYSNPSNPLAHELTTAKEIWEDTGGRVTHFVAGLGTTGTITGTSRGLKKFNADVQVVAVQPDSSFHGLEGLKHLDSSIVPAIYDPSAHDEQLFVNTDDGWDMAERLAQEEGLAVGYSSGAAVVGALRVAEQLSSGVVVTILCDHADRYIARPVARKRRS